jgi:hypothetical protein
MSTIRPFAEDAEDGHAVDPDVRHETDDPSERFQVDVLPIVERRRKNRINPWETPLERNERSPPGGSHAPFSFPAIILMPKQSASRIDRTGPAIVPCSAGSPLPRR